MSRDYTHGKTHGVEQSVLGRRLKHKVWRRGCLFMTIRSLMASVRDWSSASHVCQLSRHYGYNIGSEVASLEHEQAFEAAFGALSGISEMRERSGELRTH